MISDELLEALTKDDERVQKFSRASYDKWAAGERLSNDAKAKMWDVAFQAGASYGALATAKSVNQGWKDAAERAAISKVILKP